MLINLLSNANRHTSGGAVSIQAEVLEGKVRVTVTDNGEGIAPELKPHVFERFCHGEKGCSVLLFLLKHEGKTLSSEEIYQAACEEKVSLTTIRNKEYLLELADSQ